MFDKKQEKIIKEMLAAYDNAELQTLLESAPEEFEFSKGLESSIEKMRRKDIIMTANVKRIIIIAAALVLAIAATSIGLVAQNDSKHKSTLGDEPGRDIEVTSKELDLTQLDFTVITAPDGYVSQVTWERLALWGADLESGYPKHFQIIVDEVFDDTVIDVEAGIEYETAKINGTEVIIKSRTETVEFEDRTENWAYIDYHYIRDNYYIFAQQTIMLPYDHAEDYVDEAKISDKEVLEMMEAIEKQIRDVNGLK